MKRSVELHIDELRLPAGSPGGPRTRDAVAAQIARLIAGGAGERDGDRTHQAVARAVHAQLAPHVGERRP
jgi:hypothetical protein